MNDPKRLLKTKAAEPRRPNWHAIVKGKGMAIIWDKPITRSAILKALKSNFCTNDVEVSI